VATATVQTSPRTPASRPNLVSVGTIIWLSSELMFFAALFAMYFTIRSVDKGQGLAWPGAHLDIALGSVNTTVLLLSSVTCQMGVFAVERGQIKRTRGLFHPMSWGLREWYVLSLLMGTYFVLGQGYEYLDLIRKQGLTLSSSNYGSVFYLTTGFHGLHVTGGLIAFIFLLGRQEIYSRTAGQRDRRVVLLALRRRRVDRPVHHHLPHPLVRGQRVGWINARRRRPVAGYAALLLGLVVVGLLYGVLTRAGGGAEAAPTTAQQDIANGQVLFEATCSSCHGLDAQGSSQAPSLIGSGAAAVYFQMSTGRMPAAEVGAENPRKPVKFTEQEILDIADYVQSLGGGPEIPTPAQVSTAGADTALGSQLFMANCAQCHGFAGDGGALTYGKFAPALTQSTPTQIYTAMLTGPEAMPVFGDGALSPQAKRDIIAYVVKTRTEPNPGGLSLGRIGPVTEGLVVFLGGMGVLVLIAMWITAKRREPWDVAQEENARRSQTAGTSGTSGTEH
jgi:ubiquinol-cytochrome c reductase cytochrome c subunit